VEAIVITVITSVFALITAFGVELIRRQNKRLTEVHDASRAALTQVKNNHSSNLRDDVDDLLDGLAAVLRGQDRHDSMFRRQSSDIRRISSELRAERREREALAERVEALTANRSTRR
jgi:hypothetical protein